MSIDIKLSIQLLKDFLEKNYQLSDIKIKDFIMKMVDILYCTPYKNNYIDLLHY